MGHGGTAIDDKNNIYISWSPKIVKFSSNGTRLWEYDPIPHCGVVLWNTPVRWIPFTMTFYLVNSVALWGGAVFSSTERGAAFAVDMDTGQEIWSTQVMKEHPIAGAISNSFVQVYDGVMVLDTILHVHGLNATTGEELWTFVPDDIMWSFLATTPGDGTIVFQDIAGQAYRINLKDGSPIWKAGGVPGTWTDGSAMVGPNNIVYAVNTELPGDLTKLNGRERKNVLRAYSLSDGKLLWKTELARPPNNVPAVVRLGTDADYTVIQSIGLQDTQNESYHIHAFDATTGKLKWTFDGPTQVGLHQGSYDLPEAEQANLVRGWTLFCIPTPWSALTVDATGTVYIGNQEGPIFALRDLNGDGRVEGEGEVSSYETQRAFAGSEAPSFAPGMLVFTTCDRLFVFKYSEE